MTQAALAARAQDAGQILHPAVPAKAVETIVKAIRRVENGEIQVPREQWYIDAFSQVLDLSPEELFGVSRVEDSDSPAERFAITSHKFVPVYIGAEAAAEIAADPDMVPGTCEWMPVHTMTAPIPGATCTITCFEFGVLLFHIIESGPFPSIGELAVWRVTSEAEREGDVTEFIRARWPQAPSAASHTFHAYWLDRSGWDGDDLGTAMRLICHSSTLLQRRTRELPFEEALVRAEAAERDRFAQGFVEQDMPAVGVDGVSIGYVCWSGLSYLSLAPERAVRQDEMATFETVVQALWCYCNVIAEAVAEQADPQVPDQYGKRFLRACWRRLTSPGPHDTGQVRQLHEGILETSRIKDMLADAITDLT